jgi:hypothetical protein
MLDDKALPCIVCDRELTNIDGPNQPSNGIAFSTPGHYGTTVFDPMDGSRLEINVCDPCMRGAATRGQVLHYRPGGHGPWKAPQ